MGEEEEEEEEERGQCAEGGGARLVKEDRVSDQASNVCLSGSLGVELPAGTSGGRLCASSVTPVCVAE